MLCLVCGTAAGRRLGYVESRLPIHDSSVDYVRRCEAKDPTSSHRALCILFRACARLASPNPRLVYDLDCVMHPQEHAIRIAVASQNYRTVSGHAGKCRRFLVFEAEHGTAPREVERLDLAQELTFREFAGNGPHPLDSVQVVIVASAGAGFIGRMAARGIEVITTPQPDPLSAATQYVAGNLRRDESAERMRGAAEEATEFLKAMANETRLMILCALLQGEKSVSELEQKLDLSQSRVSQQLARLRRAELVANRPAGSTVYYSLSSPQVHTIVGALYEAHCVRAAKHSPDGAPR